MSREAMRVAIQSDQAPFANRGVKEALAFLCEPAGVNMLFLATSTWIPAPLAPGSSKPGGVPEVMGDDHGLFVEVVEASGEFGITPSAWIGDCLYERVRELPGFSKFLQHDLYGKKSNEPCYNHPSFREWYLAGIEDYLAAFPIAGFFLCPERVGPLNWLIHTPTPPNQVVCFCSHCKRKGEERGFDPQRARAGYHALVEWNHEVARSHRDPSYDHGLLSFVAKEMGFRLEETAQSSPTKEGAFVAFWRTLLSYPEILAWQKLWLDSKHEFFGEIYRKVKALAPDKHLGLHVWHLDTLSPFFKADDDYAQMKHYFDFLKVVSKNNCAGGRFHRIVTDMTHAVFADSTPELVGRLMLDMLGLDEGPFDSLPTQGFSRDSVRRDTAQAVAAVGDEYPIYSSIDIDIPTFAGDSTCSPDGIRAAVSAALEGGAKGLVLSRNYAEMRPENLAATGDALHRLGYR